MQLKQAGQWLLDVLYPRRCPYCGSVIGFGTCSEACTRAAAAAQRPDGLALSRESHTFGALHAAWAPFAYVPPVQQAVLRIKFGQTCQHVPFYAQRLACTLTAACPDKPWDMLIPVPSYGKERRGRTDLPLETALRLGRLLGVPVRPRALAKIRETQRQMTLSAEERHTNVARAFSAVPAVVRGRRILLVDDVITTGSTMSACAEALLAAGAVQCDGAGIAAVP